MKDPFLENCGGWTPAPDALTRNKMYGFEGAYLWGRLRRLCQLGGGKYTISHEALGDRIGMSRRTVIKYLDRLIEDGYVEDLDSGVKNRAHTYSVQKGEDKITSGMQISHTNIDIEPEIETVGPDDSNVGMRNLPTTINECAEIAQPDGIGVQNLPTGYAEFAQDGMQNLHLNRDSLETPKDTKQREKEEDNPTPTCDPRWAKIWQLWTDNVHLSESPLVIEEMQQEKYLSCPFEWWQQTVIIVGRNRVFTWNYAKSILDRSIEAKESPDVLGPPKTKYDDKPQPARRGKRSGNPNYTPSPLPPTPDLPPPDPIPKWAELWRQAAGILRGQMTLATFEQVISHLQPRPNHNGTFVLAAPPGSCEQVRRLDRKILLALQQFKPEIKEIEVITQ